MGSSISEAEEIGLAKLPRSYTLYLYTLHYSRLGKKLTSIAPLAPVYHIIIDHLALVAPTKAVVLSKYVYDFITPSLYRNVIASKTLLRGLESSDPGLQRKLKCLEHVETLRVQDMAGMWHVSMLNHEAAEQQRKNVFPNCRRVELCRDVVNGHYHSKTGENVEDWEFFEIKEMLMEQVKEGCDMVEVRRLRAERQEDDTKSMTFSLAVRAHSHHNTDTKSSHLHLKR
ncbi:hypothetical protein I350_05531 [Cryptococcus amylolentus CBS 6273]|uniref:Uncharacterized protein n=1 Tax=Cryptococcus amylolentus CBS 6273 TaxID=1296118 RepID=A0A1E3JVN8_9TREE|nr:hypothetical protein I350_05531 [Cryptococcus amylolentus CBS 6273]